MLIAHLQPRVLDVLKNINFLNGTVSPDPDKIQAISDMPKPKTGQDMQRFLGMVDYYHKHLPLLSKLAAPLIITWSESLIAAFENIKNMSQIKKFI